MGKGGVDGLSSKTSTSSGRNNKRSDSIGRDTEVVRHARLSGTEAKSQ